MPAVVLVCGTCQEVRYRSIREDHAVGEKANLRPQDFLPIGEQPAPSDQPPTCGVCASPLHFTFDSERRFTDNGRGPASQESPRQRYQQALAAGGSPEEAQRAVRGQVATAPGIERDPTIRVFFAVGKDEQIKDLRELTGGDRWLIITNQRIVMVDLSGAI